ncbi:MAG: 3-hydroxyacyl-CoA dehydrogenase NAD-binding domain-containing protein [Myxococcota bacterium]
MPTPSRNAQNLRLEIDEDGIAILTFDCIDSAVNIISREVGIELTRLLEEVAADPRVRALIVASGKQDNFIAGADIELLKRVASADEGAALARELQAVFDRIESLHLDAHKPVVAAIHGSCMGGGVELSLACSARFCSDSPTTIMALPEVKLGLFPGAGGTQRLPRLIGVAHAIDIIVTGRSLRSRQAKRIGLVDEVVPRSILVEAAKAYALGQLQNSTTRPAQSLSGRVREFADSQALQRLVLETNPVGLGILFQKARERVLKQTRGNYPGPEAALDVMRLGLEQGLAIGLQAEAQRFGELLVTAQARALMGLFFATRELKKMTPNRSGIRGEVRKVKKLGIVGGGLMGGGIAAVSAQRAGLAVRIREVDERGVAQVLGHVRRGICGQAQRRGESGQQSQRLLRHVTASTDLRGFGNVDMVIEAVYEDLSLKRQVLQEIEDVVGEKTIFASNTSSLPIAAIAQDALRPQNVIGMHYFSPVEKMPLLEVVETAQTAPWVCATCAALGQSQGKTVIVVKDGPGFYTSRILTPFLNEAGWLLEEGADIVEVESAMKTWGFAVGPLTLIDAIGIDVSVKVSKLMQEAFPQRMLAPGCLSTLLADDRYGRKNGRGFFHYPDGRKGSVDVSVYGCMGGGVERRAFVQQDIHERLSLQMVNEAAWCLQEGILGSPRDGDVGATLGLGFPAFRGGPFWYLDQVGVDWAIGRLERWAERFGERFAPAAILREYARSGKSFR